MREPPRGWIVRSHNGWKGEWSISYKHMETSPSWMRFNFKGKAKGKSTVIISNGKYLNRHIHLLNFHVFHMALGIIINIFAYTSNDLNQESLWFELTFSTNCQSIHPTLPTSIFFTAPPPPNSATCKLNEEQPWPFKWTGTYTLEK